MDLTRFNAHAPFVKTLRTSSPYVVNFPPGWPIPAPELGSNPLLPNLEHLVMSHGPEYCPQLKHTLWVSRLLHPNLLEFEMAQGKDENLMPRHAWLDREACVHLVGQLSRACPRLEILHIYPAHLAEIGGNECSIIYNSITSMVHLRSFAFTEGIVHSELFESLGQLPYLEILSLRANKEEHWTNVGEDINVPDDSFPSLRHLDLDAVDEFTICRICKVVPLFHNLISASIIFRNDFGDEFFDDYGRSNIATTCIGANSPHLERLTVLQDADGEFDSFVVNSNTQHMVLRCWSYFGYTWDNAPQRPRMPKKSMIATAARYLHRMRPNVTCESYYTRPVNGFPKDPPDEQTVLELNNAIRLLKRGAQD
ncbi:hypothetical protein FRC07_007499 [Ceratobasidium sp. 392]|nr:hypothetical protein FRC07_007499 [Ceratobasidium sp. 392]